MRESPRKEPALSLSQTSSAREIPPSTSLHSDRMQRSRTHLPSALAPSSDWCEPYAQRWTGTCGKRDRSGLSPPFPELSLEKGARRFVFEGRECGGHVGPRSSFVLWESAIDRLLARERLGDVSVLFAGGVHDALSARIVATLAAPLAARGVKVGVLMGTAYLFTDEAVACGAIRPAFQEAAIQCDSTALLETAPGHATRCAVSKYVRAFENERSRLEGETNDPRAPWAALAQINLGGP